MLKFGTIFVLFTLFMTFSVVKGSGSASIKELSDFKSFLLMKKLEVQSLKRIPPSRTTLQKVPQK